MSRISLVCSIEKRYIRINKTAFIGFICLDQIIDIFDAVAGFELETTYDYADHLDAVNMAFIREHIQTGIPIIVGWNDWGGHWQVIIGYDTMGTEYEGDDVIIVADSFDTTDHNQDGYGVYGA